VVWDLQECEQELETIVLPISIFSSKVQHFDFSHIFLANFFVHFFDLFFILQAYALLYHAACIAMSGDDEGSKKSLQMILDIPERQRKQLERMIAIKAAAALKRKNQKILALELLFVIGSMRVSDIGAHIEPVFLLHFIGFQTGFRNCF
jgi:hypothetical protein